MGHSTARAALIYQHASADRDRLIADAVSGLVKKGRKRGARRSKKKDKKPDGHGGLIGAPGCDKGQAEELSSGLAFCHLERVTGIEPA